MMGQEVFKVAVKNLTSASKAALEAAGLTTGDIDWVVAHQANLRIITQVASRLDIPLERFVLNIERYGNTSSASIPIALDEAVRDGRIKPGQTVLMCALGAGISWGSALVTDVNDARRLVFSRARVAGRRHGQRRSCDAFRGGARRVRARRRGARRLDQRALLRGPRSRAHAHAQHAARDRDDEHRRSRRAARARADARPPVSAAGHSLGEYSALVARGALALEDAVRLVRLRGEAMQEAVPAGHGAMAAIMGVDAREARRALRRGRAGRGGEPRELQRARADRDRRARRPRSRAPASSVGRTAGQGHPAQGERAVPLRAHGARRARARRRGSRP